MPCNQTKTILVEISGIIQRFRQQNDLQRRYKHVGICILISSQTHTHSLSGSHKHPFIVRRHPIQIILRRIHNRPRRPRHNLIKHRRIRITIPVNSPVEVRRPDHVFPAAINRHDVAEFLETVAGDGERPDRRKGGVQNR